MKEIEYNGLKLKNDKEKISDINYEISNTRHVPE